MKLKHQRDMVKLKLFKPYSNTLYKLCSLRVILALDPPSQGTPQAQRRGQKFNRDHACPTSLEARVVKVHKQCEQANASTAQRIKRQVNLLIIRREYKTQCRFTQVKCRRIK